MKLASFVGAVLAKVEGSEKLHKNLRRRRKKKSATKNSKWKAIVNSNLSFGRKRMCQKKKTEEGTPEKKSKGKIAKKNENVKTANERKVR